MSIDESFGFRPAVARRQQSAPTLVFSGDPKVEQRFKAKNDLSRAYVAANTSSRRLGDPPTSVTIMI
ncbi:hypothetical protein EVAR_65576_1 [Eumeta japonica]|uniref:Uncharacterized protein n=1 Tax=Eumeta variegata TaxID=151549 RepID=A0A4C1YZS2_EUMVA|nr:hypothetical protein EVAR_65576_1 [Eumeta japonica]